MTDTCMGIGCTCVRGKVSLPSDGHGLDDTACFSVDAVIVINGVQSSLQSLERGEDAGGCVTSLNRPLFRWCVGCGADTMIEQVSVERFECLVWVGIGWSEVGEGSDDGITYLKS